MKLTILIPLIIGISLDLLDFTIGWIPFLGDIFDILGAIYFYTQIKYVAIIGLIELIPFMDFVPFWTGLGFYAVFIKNKEEKV